MKFPREAIGVPEHPEEFVILPHGAVDFCVLRKYYTHRAPENSGQGSFALGEKPVQFGTGKPPARRLLEGYMPIVLLDWEHDGLRCEQTAFGWSQGMSSDAPLWAYLRLKVSNPGDQRRTAKVGFQLALGKPAKVIPVATWTLELAAGGEQCVHAKLPAEGGVPREPSAEELKQRSRHARPPFISDFRGAAEVPAAEFDARLREAADTWRTLLNRGTTLRVPEPRVHDAYRAWLAYTFLDVDKRRGIYEPHDGAGFYEAVFGIIAAKYCQALDFFGYPDLAERYLNSLQTFVKPDGLFVVNFGLSDTGSLLYAIDQHARMTGDKGWLRLVAPNALRMCDWIIRKRRAVKAQQDRESAYFGLIEYRPSADYPKPDYNYVTDTYLCIGMEAAVHALREAGMAKDADRVAAEAEAYRRDILASMERATFEHKGTALLPILPRSRGWLAKANFQANWYYTLFGSIVLDSQFLPAASDHARRIAETLEQRGGLILGMCTHGAAIDHAFTFGYWHHALRSDQPKRAILGLYGSLAYGMSRGTWAGVEVTHIRSGRNGRTLPHLRSGTQQLRLLRMMLVREEGDTLHLAQAVPQHWLDHGQRVEVLGAPTCFGTLSYTIHSDVDDGRIRVDLDPPTRTPPKTIQLYLRHPGAKPIQSVTIQGKPTTDFTPGCITLPALRAPTTIDVRFR